MTTMNFTFTPARSTNHFNATDKDFKWMRRYVMSLESSIINACFMSRLVDVFDDIKEMEVGAEMFFAVSPYDVFCYETLDELNAGCESIAKTLGKNYLASNFGGFKVKRTSSKWIIGNLDYELK